LFGGEVVLAGDRVLGTAKSAGYGYTVDYNIVCAYLPVADLGRDDCEIEVMGERYPLRAHQRPPYDPDRRKILA
jgi:glycine cleavage system aminomethyltransferase T